MGTIQNSYCQQYTTEQQNWMQGLTAYLKGWEMELRCREHFKTDNDSNTNEDFRTFLKKFLMISGRLLDNGMLTWDCMKHVEV